jgi:hypothetical protein
VATSRSVGNAIGGREAESCANAFAHLKAIAVDEGWPGTSQRASIRQEPGVVGAKDTATLHRGREGAAIAA